MSDELSIQPQVQQKQSSPMPYVVGGAIGGGLVGGATAYYTTKPKYASYEDIIKDSKDNFEKAAKEVISEEAEQTKAINAYQAGVDAGNKWENDKKAYIDANKGGAVIPDDNYKNLEADLETKTKALEDKRTALIDKEVEALKKNNTGSLTDEEKKVADKLNKKIEGIETSKNAYISAREKAINTVNTKISEPRTAYSYKEFGKTINSEGNAFEQLVQRKKTFETTISSVESHLKDGKFKKGSELTFVDPKTKKVVTRVPKNAQEVKLAKQYFEKAYNTDLANMFKGVDRGILNSVADEAAVVVQNNITNNENVANKEAFLKKKTTEYNKALADIPSEKDVLSEVRKNAKKDSPIEALVQRYDANESEIAKLKARFSTATGSDKKSIAKQLANREANAEGMKKSIRATYNMLQDGPLVAKKGELETQQLYKKIQRADELLTKESGSVPSKTWIGRVLGIENPAHLTPAEAKELKGLQDALAEAEKNLGSKEFQKAETTARLVTNVDSEISRLEGEIKTLDDKVKVRREAEKKVAEITKQVEEWAGKGATIDASGNILKADGSVFKPEATTNLAGKVGVPLNDPKVAGYDRQIAGIKAHVPTEGTVLTDAEILEKAKANVGEGALKAESDAQKLAQKALDDAKAKLPKGEAKTEEQLVKEFIEKNGEKSEAMKKAFGEDVKALLEKKIPNKKLAAYIGGGAAILAALGYMIAPKHSEDIA